VRTLAVLVAVLAATMVAGCSGGDEGDAASAHGRPVTIVADLDVTTEKGTFRVEKGSEELGCSGGTFVNHHLGQDEWSVLQKVLTCTEGERSGSFVIRMEAALARYRWNFQSGTGDFAGVKGKGKFSERRNPAPELSGVETLTGTVRF
jgi:hypothetical protein